MSLDPTVFVDQFLIDVLRAELDPVEFLTEKPSDVPARAPMVLGSHTGGEEKDYRFGDYADIQIDTYGTSKTAAFNLAKQTRLLLRTAWETQHVYPSGHVGNYENTLTPRPFTDSLMPSGIWRFTAEYRLLLRPPVT